MGSKCILKSLPSKQGGLNEVLRPVGGILGLVVTHFVQLIYTPAS